MSKNPKVHMSTRGGARRFTCGSRGKNGTETPEQVTCSRCRQLLGLGESWAQGHARKLPRKKPLPPASSAKALDSLIGRAFKHIEGELAIALVEGERALAESLKCKDPGEIIAELSGALRRLVDLLGSVSSN